MKRTSVGLVMVALAVIFVVSFVEAQPPDLIVVERQGVAPEGIEYDPVNGRFLITSLSEGTIFAVADDGTHQPFIEERDLIATTGIEVDVERNRLLVTTSDPIVFDVPGILGKIGFGVYDLTTGERLQFVDLTFVGPLGSHLANDVTFDADGNAYITDTFAPVIYKVDLDGNASVFIEDERLSSETIGLNGIVYHPDGYLITGVTDSGVLFKIPLDDPAGLMQIAIDQPIGVDGMVWHPDGSLIVVDGFASSVVKLRSDDGWMSAEVEATVVTEQQATTAAIRDGEVYALYAHLFEEPPPLAYEIVRVEFEPEEPPPTDPPDLLPIERPGLTPEGIEYDTVAGRFLVGSLAEGTVFSVDFNGVARPFAEDAELVSSIGIEADEATNRLFVCNNDFATAFDPAAPQFAKLGIYDLTTGERLHMVDLAAVGPAGQHFVNDVTVDADGNAYVTDSFAPVIYKVDPDGNASIFAEAARFGGEGFNLNGIVTHPNGYLLAVKSNSGQLFKVPLDNPSGTTEVIINRSVNGDGMVWLPNGDLVVVARPEILSLRSDNDWATASVVGISGGHGLATTAAARGDEVHAIYAHLDEFFAGTPADAFEIVRVQFTPVPPTEEAFEVFSMPLARGLNMISLPLQPLTPYSAKTLLEEVGATVVIRLETEAETGGQARFSAFTVADSTESGGFSIDGGKGYIVNTPDARTVVFVGTAWTNDAPASPALPTSQPTWAFVVGGRLDTTQATSPSPHYHISVTNLNRGTSATDSVNPAEGLRFGAVWADLNRQSVIEVGDVIRVEITDAQERRVISPVEYRITQGDIENAFVDLRLSIGEPLPTRHALLQNYPNPFNPETWIPFELAEPALLTLTIYDATGALVREIALGHTPAGTYTSKTRAIFWDGRNNTGESVASGVYFYQITADNFRSVRKMIVLK